MLLEPLSLFAKSLFHMYHFPEVNVIGDSMLAGTWYPVPTPATAVIAVSTHHTRDPRAQEPSLFQLLVDRWLGSEWGQNLTEG